jgi:sporulation protein YlmC with PRC-barrel domain
MPLHPLRAVAGANLPASLDLRNWSVVARDGSALGTVAEVIVDVESRAPVYLQIVPHEPPDGSPPECWIRVPYREVKIDQVERNVVMSDIALLGLGTATAGLATGRAR